MFTHLAAFSPVSRSPAVSARSRWHVTDALACAAPCPCALVYSWKVTLLVAPVRPSPPPPNTCYFVCWPLFQVLYTYSQIYFFKCAHKVNIVISVIKNWRHTEVIACLELHSNRWGPRPLGSRSHLVGCFSARRKCLGDRSLRSWGLLSCPCL